MNQTILLVGGTRGTGLLIAKLLQGKGHKVRALARNPARAMARLGSVVEVIAGDITKADTLPPALRGISHIIFTAGVRSGRLARETLFKATEYHGVLNTLAASRAAGFGGRFLYMTSIGVATPSFSAALLNSLKGNTLAWRRRAEGEIRTSGLDYTIIRVGFLLNRLGGQRAVDVSQGTPSRSRLATGSPARTSPKPSSRRSSTPARRARRSKSYGAEDAVAKTGACSWAG